MGSKYFWKVPGGIQGQAGKPYAHQPGPVIQYPCMSQPVDNGCLCNYRAYKYWIYYEYLSPQLEPVSDAIVWDASSKFWSTSSTMGYKWKPLGSQYGGCANKDKLQDTNLYRVGSWLPFGMQYGQEDYNLYSLTAWSNGSTYNKASYKIPTLGNVKKLSYVDSTSLDRALRFYIVNTYECCGGSYYCGSQGVSSEVISSQPSNIYSTGNVLCAVDYKVTQSYPSYTVKATAKYSSQSSIKKYSQVEKYSCASLRLYTEVPAGTSDYAAFCEGFASANSSTALSRGSFLMRAPYGRFCTFLYTTPAIPTYKKYDPAYARQAISWSVQPISYMYNIGCTEYFPGQNAYGSDYNSGGDFFRFSVISIASDYFWSCSTEQEVLSAWSSLASAYSPAESTIEELQPLAVTIKGWQSTYNRDRYPVCDIDITSAAPPCNVPDVQGQVWDSNYSFIKWDIWSAGTFSAASSVVQYPSLYQYHLQAPLNNLTSGVFSSDLYEYQLFNQGWIKNNQFVSLRTQYPGKVFKLVQHGATSAGFRFNSFTYLDSQYAKVGAWLDYYQFVYPAYTYASSYYTSALNAPAEAFDSLWRLESFCKTYDALIPGHYSNGVYVPYIINTKGTNSYIWSDGATTSTSMQDRATGIAATNLIYDARGPGGHTLVQDELPTQLQNDKWVTVYNISTYGPYSSQGSLHKTLTPRFTAGYFADPEGSYGCYNVSLTALDKRYWYRAHKYSLVCKNSSFYYLADQTQLENSQYVHYIQYPAVKFQNEVLSRFAGSSIYNSGPEALDSVIDPAAGDVNSVYVWYPLVSTYAVTDLNDPLLYDYTHDVTSEISQQGVDVYWSGIAPVSSQLNSGFAATSVFSNRYQALVSAVSGTQCAFCQHFSTVVFQPEAQLPAARLGYTYLKPPKTWYNSYYYSSSGASSTVTWRRQDWRSILYTFTGARSAGWYCYALYNYTGYSSIFSVSSGSTHTWSSQLSGVATIAFSFGSRYTSPVCSFDRTVYWYTAPDVPAEGDSQTKTFVSGTTYASYSKTIQYPVSMSSVYSNYKYSSIVSCSYTVINKDA